MLWELSLLVYPWYHASASFRVLVLALGAGLLLVMVIALVQRILLRLMLSWKVRPGSRRR